jgi:hypothetical protein
MLNGDPNNTLTNKLTKWSKILHQMLRGPQSINYPQFMKPEDSLPHSQATTTCPYPQTEKTSPCCPIPLLEDPI